MSNYTEYVTKNGERLLIKRVPRMLLARFQARLPQPPAPPRVKTILDGIEVEREDRENIEWQAKVSAVNSANALKLAEFTLHMGVRLPKERRDEIVSDVDELRERAMAAGLEMHPDNETAYIIDVALDDVQDLQSVQKIMFGQNFATEEAVQQHVDEFRREA